METGRVLTGVIVLALSLFIFIANAYSADDAVVIGRMVGTRLPLPLYFRNSDILLSRGIDEVEFYGFKLMRQGDGKKHIIRPNRDGYFHQKLTPGSYMLLRDRKPSLAEKYSLSDRQAGAPTTRVDSSEVVFKEVPFPQAP